MFHKFGQNQLIKSRKSDYVMFVKVQDFYKFYRETSITVQHTFF